MKSILITGGCGYVGTVLSEMLLKEGHHVCVYDIQWFGNYLKPHPNLQLIKGDIRDIDDIDLTNFDIIVHLANIANDPSVELNTGLSWETNVLAGQQLIDKAVRANIQQFIYASSGSVYGVKDEQNVTEDLSLVPISVYNKTKMVAERVFLSYKNDIKVHCIRPATVCGWSPRMRLDVSVNMLTMQALQNKVITVFGGNQIRPNIHIQDMVRVYRHFIDSSEIPSGCYNAGFENISIIEIAELVAKEIPAEIVVTKSNDPRSYRQNSDKLLKTGFQQKYSITDAIKELCEKYHSGDLEDQDQYYTVKWMKHLGLDK